MQEEVELRSVWLSLVYLTLANVRHESEAPSAVRRVRAGGDPLEVPDFVYDVVNAAQGGYTLESLKLEDMLRRQGTDSASLRRRREGHPGQSMRVVFLTLTVRDEAAAAGDLPPPRRPGPSIPGAPAGDPVCARCVGGHPVVGPEAVASTPSRRRASRSASAGPRVARRRGLLTPERAGRAPSRGRCGPGSRTSSS